MIDSLLTITHSSIGGDRTKNPVMFSQFLYEIVPSTVV